MKKLITLALFIVALLGTSCEKAVDPFAYDSSEKVYVGPYKSSVTKGFFDGDTTYLDSLKRIFDPKKHISWGYYLEPTERKSASSIPFFDYPNYKIAWLADNIIGKDPKREGHYLLNGIAAGVSNMVLVNTGEYHSDTVAYVPNKVTHKVHRDIQLLLDQLLQQKDRELHPVGYGV